MARKFVATVGRKQFSSTAPGIQGLRDAQFSARADMAQVINNYNKFINHLINITPEILLEALEPTFEKSKEYCPKDTGSLVESGYLEVTTFRGSPRVEMGYGRGGSPSYAVTVHENLEWRHKAPTRAKWLQIALEEDEAEINQRIQAAYRQVF